jgi:FeS assembly SUF system protein
MTENLDLTSNIDDPAAQALRERIVDVLKTVYDPEIPVDIYEMGLIYRVAVKQANEQNAHPVDLVMTLTSPMCPVAETLPPEVEEKVRSVEGVAEVHLDLVWDPPWTPDMMSEAAKLALNM